MHDDPASRESALHDAKPELQEKFKEFRQLLQQEVDQVFTYRSLRDLEMAVRFNMPQMLERYPVTGWVRPQNTQALHDEIDQLKAKVAQLERDGGTAQLDPFLSLPKVAMHEIFLLNTGCMPIRMVTSRKSKSRKTHLGTIVGIAGLNLCQSHTRRVFLKAHE